MTEQEYFEKLILRLEFRLDKIEIVLTGMLLDPPLNRQVLLNKILENDRPMS